MVFLTCPSDYSSNKGIVSPGGFLGATNTSAIDAAADDSIGTGNGTYESSGITRGAASIHCHVGVIVTFNQLAVFTETSG